MTCSIICMKKNHKITRSGLPCTSINFRIFRGWARVIQTTCQWLKFPIFSCVSHMEHQHTTRLVVVRFYSPAEQAESRVSTRRHGGTRWWFVAQAKSWSGLQATVAVVVLGLSMKACITRGGYLGSRVITDTEQMIIMSNLTIWSASVSGSPAFFEWPRL